MATLTITNVSGAVLSINELYVDLAIGASVAIDRPQWSLSSLYSLHALMESGKVTVSVVYSSAELVAQTSGLLAGATVDKTFPQIRTAPGTLTEPTVIEVGPTLGWIFEVGDFAYVEIPLHIRIDRSHDVEIEVSWAPAGSEIGKKVSWQIAIGAEKVGSSVITIDDTVTAVDADVPPVVATYADTTLLIPAALIADLSVDELHLRVTRVASSNDPVTDPGLHSIEVLQHLL